MATTQAKLALRAYRKANGLCIHCGAKAVKRLTRCRRCAARDRANRQRYAARDKAAGICVTLGCDNRARTARVYCDQCAGKQAAAERKRVLDGKCVKCVKPATNGKYCKKHAKMRSDYMKRFRADRIAAGLCTGCGNHNLDGTRGRCGDCLARYTKYRRQLKLDVMNAYGGPVCVGCGDDEILILQIDHVNGGGAKHGRAIGGRGKMYKWLKDNGYPPGYRVLCPSCNVRAARGLQFPNETKLKKSGRSRHRT